MEYRNFRFAVVAFYLPRIRSVLRIVALRVTSLPFFLVLGILLRDQLCVGMRSSLNAKLMFRRVRLVLLLRIVRGLLVYLFVG